MLLPVLHDTQKHSVSCVPACVRMVLSFLGIEQSELTLSHILQLGEEGTSLSNIKFLEGAGIGVTVWVGFMDSDPDAVKEAVKSFLDSGIPVIVAVWTAPLPYWQKDVPHAVVVVGYDEQEDYVYLNDPKFRDTQTVPWNDFLVAWGGLSWHAAYIQRERFSKL